MKDETMLTTSTVPAKAGRKEWIGLAVISIPCLIYSMDLSILYLAIPMIAADFKPGAAEQLWIMDIYGFMVAGFLITMGTLGDRIGRRRLLMIGAGAFAVASVIAAFAPNAPMLIFGRALLGIAAATLAPSTLSLIRNMFLDDKERTFAVGVWIACFSAGGVLGPLAGGLLLSWFSWSAAFLINVPFMLALLAVAPILLPEYRDPNVGRLDLLSALMSLAAVLAIIFGLKQMAEQGISLTAVAIIVIGLVVGLLFVRRQFTLSEPLVDLTLFSSPAFSVSLLINILSIFLAFGVFFFVTQYFQLVVGLDPWSAGWWTAPGGVIMIVVSMLTSVILRYIRPAHVIAGGFLLIALAMVLMAQANGPESFWTVFWGFLLLSTGVSPMAAVTTDLVMSAAPSEKAGSASGISETSFEFGGALGVAVLGSVVTALYRGAMEEPLTGSLAVGVIGPARDTLAGAVAAAAHLSPGEGSALLALARSAYVDAFAVAAIIGMGMAVFGAVLALAMIGRGRPRELAHQATP
jgi:DHA2 family multidrug resistance protein-like MFS transporter